MNASAPGNPYITSSGRPELRRSVVAYVDILGYMELATNPVPNAETVLQNLHGALTRARRHIDPERIQEEVPFFGNDSDHAFRAFTDNIVIGFPVREDAERELGEVFQYLAYFQMMMVIEGFFVRGAISVGHLYMDDIVVFGDALIEAYRGETTLARDPRIVLTESAAEAVDIHLGYYDHGPHAPQNRNLIRDTDGQLFLNYLDVLVPDTDVLFETELRRHKNQITRKLGYYRNNPPLWSKYHWAARYHNYWCNREPNVPSDCRINLDEHAPEMRPLV